VDALRTCAEAPKILPSRFLRSATEFRGPAATRSIGRCLAEWYDNCSTWTWGRLASELFPAIPNVSDACDCPFRAARSPHGDRAARWAVSRPAQQGGVPEPRAGG
jgi:hypothetical protein